MICCHCRTRRAYRRGLCQGCYHTPLIRALYPPMERGPKVMVSSGPLPAEPCPFSPWSDGRIATMAARAERGEATKHPLDFRPEG